MTPLNIKLALWFGDKFNISWINKYRYEIEQYYKRGDIMKEENKSEGMKDLERRYNTKHIQTPEGIAASKSGLRMLDKRYDLQ